MKKKKKYLRYIILVAAICVFIFSAYNLIHIFLEYKKGDDAYDNIAGEVSPDSTDEAGTPWVWDYDAMLAINADTKGWIKQDDIISYPILQTDNNDYYLTHLANREKNKSGSIFIDCNITDGLQARNCIIYGHNMKNKAMFGSLKGYRSKSYYKDHKYFDIYIEREKYTYEVFAAYEVPEISDAYTYSFADDNAFLQYLNLSRSRSIYKTDFRELTAVDKVITLSTCTNDDDTKRFLVQLVRSN